MTLSTTEKKIIEIVSNDDKIHTLPSITSEFCQWIKRSDVNILRQVRRSLRTLVEGGFINHEEGVYSA